MTERTTPEPSTSAMESASTQGDGGFTFFVDTALCTKCWACEVACKAWHGFPAGGLSRRRVCEITEGAFPTVSRTFFSVSCLHCVDAPCVEVCPVDALTQRDDGIVVIDTSACILCHQCFGACPYGIPQYSESSADWCDGCLSLGVQPGEEPHCVTACPTGATTFGPRAQLGEPAESLEDYTHLVAAVKPDQAPRTLRSS